MKAVVRNSDKCINSWITTLNFLNIGISQLCPIFSGSWTLRLGLARWRGVERGLRPPLARHRLSSWGWRTNSACRWSYQRDRRTDGELSPLPDLSVLRGWLASLLSICLVMNCLPIIATTHWNVKVFAGRVEKKTVVACAGNLFFAALDERCRLWREIILFCLSSFCCFRVHDLLRPNDWYLQQKSLAACCQIYWCISY